MASETRSIFTLSMEKKFMFVIVEAKRMGQKTVFCGYSAAVEKLYDDAASIGDFHILKSGAASARSGKYTGRVPQYKRIVDNLPDGMIDWGDVNKRITSTEFQILLAKAKDLLEPVDDQQTYEIMGIVGPGSPGVGCEYVYVRCYVQRPYHALFMINMIRSIEGGIPADVPEHDILTIYNVGRHQAPFLENADGGVCVALDLLNRDIVIFGTEYAGEMKKGVFTFCHYHYPIIMRHPSLHSSCVVGPGDGNVTLFLGMSGTGKTTLSADSELFELLGDDEHVWTSKGVFNIEGGCYAKIINLSPEKEPDIYSSITRGAVFENVIDHDGVPDFDDSSITANTRVSYPLGHYGNRVNPIGTEVPHPRNIIFLTCDGLGVFPAVSRIPSDQIQRYFLAGYTSKMPGTEVGVVDPIPTYSACYSAPFLPLDPKIYSSLLFEKCQLHNVKVWLVNTGWFYGRRVPINLTREYVKKIVTGAFDDVEFVRLEEIGVAVPTGTEEDIYLRPDCHTPDYSNRVKSVFEKWPGFE